VHQKDLARQAWADAGLYRRTDPKLQAFLKHFEESSLECWPELVDEARTRYSEYVELLVMPLWNTGDKLLRLNLVRQADLKKTQEADLLAKLVQRARPTTEVHELRAIAESRDKKLLKLISRKRDLPPELASLVERLSATG
jgi:hypothetical protein